MEQNYEGLSDAELLAIEVHKDLPTQLKRLILGAKLREINSKPRVYIKQPPIKNTNKLTPEQIEKLNKETKQLSEQLERITKPGFFRNLAFN